MRKTFIFILSTLIYVSCVRQKPEQKNENTFDKTNLSSIAAYLLTTLESNDTTELKKLYLNNMQDIPFVYKKDFFKSLQQFKGKDLQLLKLEILPTFSEIPNGAKKMELYFATKGKVFVINSGIKESNVGYSLMGSSIEEVSNYNNK